MTEKHIGETLQDDVSYTLGDYDLTIGGRSPEMNNSKYSIAIGWYANVNASHAISLGDKTSCDEPYGFELGTSLMDIPMHEDFINACVNHPEGIKWFIRILTSSMSSGDFVTEHWKEFYSKR